jgi:hypothetical protein
MLAIKFHHHFRSIQSSSSGAVPDQNSHRVFISLTPTCNTSVAVHPCGTRRRFGSLAKSRPSGSGAGVRPGQKSRRTLRSRPGGGHPIRAPDDAQSGVPPTDDFEGPLGKGVLSTTAQYNGRVKLGRSCRTSRRSSITHLEAAPATVTCSYRGHCGATSATMWKKPGPGRV